MTENIRSFSLHFVVTAHAVIFIFGTSKSRIVHFWVWDLDARGDERMARSHASLLPGGCTEIQESSAPQTSGRSLPSLSS